MTEFIPGLDLCEAYYHEAVGPILAAHFPQLTYTAGLIGYGSDVMGYDTPVSRDHMWGPRLWIFLPPENFQAQQEAILAALRPELPVQIRGYSTHFSKPDEADGGVRVREDIDHGPVEPLIHFATVDSFVHGHLGVDPRAEPSPADWLTFSEQGLIEVTGGRLFHDGLGLEAIRRRFTYYPRDVWLYLLAAQWSLISQEEAFPGRTAQVGDELGSRIITARLAERFMRLGFLMEQRYAPYSKWFGTAFQHLKCYPSLGPLLQDLLAADTYAERDPLFARVYTQLAEMHNALGITPPVETRTRTYSGWHALRSGYDNLPLDHPHNTRPFQVIFGGRIMEAIQAAIKDPKVLALPPNIGSASQFLTSASDALQSTDFRRGLKPIFEG